MKKKTSFNIIGEYEKTKLEQFFASKDVTEMLSKIKEAPENETHTFKGLAVSTEHMDRSGEIVRQAGLDADLYMKNPVILNSHNYYGIENIVGVTTRLYPGMVDGVAATLADGKWAPTEAGEMAEALWQADCLHAASVGFIPTEFDAKDQSIITKWQLLEYSVVPVPANGWATRQEGMKILEAKGITAAGLRAKGFSVKDAEETKADAEIGDECTMDDGTLGVFSENGEGNLICVPKQDAAKMTQITSLKELVKESKMSPTLAKSLILMILKESEETGGKNDASEESMWDELKSEHKMHQDAVKGHVQELCDAIKAEREKPEEGADEEEKKAFRAGIVKEIQDHMKKFKTVMKAEHARHIKCVQDCVDGFVKAEPKEDANDDHDEEEKALLVSMIKAVTGEKLTEKEILEIVMKAGGEMKRSLHAKFLAIHESMKEGHDMHEEGADIHQKAIDEFKALLEEHEPTEGNDGKGLPPKKRSIPVVDVVDLKKIQHLSRLLNDATREGLTRISWLNSGKR